MLESDNPEEDLFLSEEPILSSVEDYEWFGKAQNVVISCGNILEDDRARLNKPSSLPSPTSALQKMLKLDNAKHIQ